MEDNDWVEVYKGNGVVRGRGVIWDGMGKGRMFMYDGEDKHIETGG
ncbi:hypothetical protein [Staphylococcus aureus]|nr:hypothetical protein [Staphylococcus aureus]